MTGFMNKIVNIWIFVFYAEIVLKIIYNSVGEQGQSKNIIKHNTKLTW